jgi:signal transduction histidine kinase
MSPDPDRKPLVLVVDDEEVLRRLVRVGLSQQFEVMEASNALEAIALVGQHDIEVVVIDVMMPGMSGLEAVPKLKAAARGPLPVLVLTALDDQENRNAGLESGADDYLGKPVNRRELVLRVQNFVRLRRQEQIIREQVEALTNLNALKDDLTALFVHDLRNPLTAVKSAFQLLAVNAKAEDRDLFDLGKAALDRVMTGIEDLLKVRMLEEGQLQLERSRFSLEDLANETANTLKAAALEGKVLVQVTSTVDSTVIADQKLLRRALENLLINTLRHTKGGIEIELSGDAQQVTMTVADRGPGVPDYLKGELFDRFGSLTLQKAGKRRGHGLGLYLVKLTAEAHGGSVKVADREGGGARFVLTLPR